MSNIGVVVLLFSAGSTRSAIALFGIVLVVQGSVATFWVVEESWTWMAGVINANLHFFAFLTVVLEVKQFTSFIRQLDLESFTSLLPQPLASPAQPLVAESRRNLPARETGQQLARSFKMITRNTRQAKEVEGQPLVAQGKLGWQQRLIHRQLHTSRPRIDANLQRVFSLARSGSWSKPFGSKSPSSIDGPQSRRFNAALDSFSSPVRTNVHGVVPTPSTYTNHTIHQPSAGPFSIVCAQNRDQQVKAGTTSSIIKPINVNQNPSAGPGKAL